MSALTQVPGYQFGFQQGGQAVDRSAASQGLLLSGGQQKASQEFGTNYALQQAWNPYVTELNSLGTQGENAAAKTGEQGTQAANNAGTAILAGGAAQSAGINSAAGALANSQLFNPYAYTGAYGSQPNIGSAAQGARHRISSLR